MYYTALSGAPTILLYRQTAAELEKAAPVASPVPVVAIASQAYPSLPRAPKAAQGAVEFPYTILPPHDTRALEWFLGGSILNKGTPRWSNDADEFLRSALVDSNWPAVKQWADWFRQSYPGVPGTPNFDKLRLWNFSAHKWTLGKGGKIYLPFSQGDYNAFVDHVLTYHMKGFRQGPPRQRGSQVTTVRDLLLQGAHRSQVEAIKAAAKTPQAQRLTRTTPYPPLLIKHIPDLGKHTASKLMVATGAAIIGGAAVKAITSALAPGLATTKAGAIAAKIPQPIKTAASIARGATGAISGSVGPISPVVKVAASAVSGAIKALPVVVKTGATLLSAARPLATKAIQAVAPTVTKLAEDYAAQQIQEKIIAAATKDDRAELERMLQDLQRQEQELRAQVGTGIPAPSGVIYALRQPGEPSLAESEALEAKRAAEWNQALKVGAIGLLALAALRGF